MLRPLGLVLLALYILLLPTTTHAKWEQFFTPERKFSELEGMCLTEFTNRIVYCEGPLIEAVNYHRLFEDSKDFVDMSLKDSPEKIVEEFKKRFNVSDIDGMDKGELHKFLDEFFDPPTSELVECVPVDWKPNPPKIMEIQDPKLRAWALDLHDLWKTLCRRINETVKENPDRHSILWVDGNFIVPGGRFREFYYSDSYWIVRGLLISDMVETAKSITRNFASIVRRYHFVPNGGRVYYTNRSQPPMLSAMAYTIYEATGDVEFIRDLLPDLETEFQWWESHRKFPVTTQKGNIHQVYMYKTGTTLPRPESMWADMEASKGLSEADQAQFFESSASAAESGWDFSSRWFADQKTLRTMETAKIVPVDLNSYMCGNMQILGFLNREVGNAAEGARYETMHQNFIWTHDEVFYNRSARGWYDFNTRTNRHTIHNYPSVATPMFTNCYSLLDENKPRLLFDNLQETGFFDYDGGVPASLIKDTNQQWDFPNGWAPLNHMLVEGLRQSADPIMQDKAFEIARKWIHGNYKVYGKTKHMYEKYDVSSGSDAGDGGEYAVVIGFGWSNGAVLDMLHSYYDRMEAPVQEDKDGGGSGTASLLPTTGVLMALLLLNLLFVRN